MQDYAYLWHRNSQFTNMGKYATISKEAET